MIRGGKGVLAFTGLVAAVWAGSFLAEDDAVAGARATYSPPAQAIDHEAERRATEEVRLQRVAEAKEHAADFLKAARAGSGPFSTVREVAPDKAVPEALTVLFGAGLWDRLPRRSQRSLVIQSQDLWQKTHCPDGSKTWGCVVYLAVYDGATVMSVANTSGLGGASVKFEDR